MHNVFKITLAILAAVLLRRSLLTNPDASPGVRIEGKNQGLMTLIPERVRADRPHPAWNKRIR